MRIGIIGSGSIGGTAAQLFEDAGHEVLVGSRSNGRVEEACGFGEMVLVATPFAAYTTLPADALDGKIVIDANNYYPGRDGSFPDLDADRTTSSELLSEHLSGARVVKAFNTLQADSLGSEGLPPGDPQRLVLFVAGDDENAKRHVADLIDEIGFEPVDTGSLADGGRRQQPGSDIYGAEMTAPDAREVLDID